MRSHTYKLEELVIGYGLNAILYAYLNNSTILINGSQKPFRFDLWEGKQKADIWSEKLFALSLIGKCPLADKVDSIRVEDGQVSVMTKNLRQIKIGFEKLRIFDGDSVEGLDFTEKIEQYRVFDWFNVRSGMRHEFDKIETISNFVKCIHFYPSDRLDGNHLDKKDLVTESFIDISNIDDFDVSSTVARLKTLATMKENGIKGTRNGRSMEDPTKYKHYALKIEYDRREKYKNKRLFVTGDLPKGVKFDITNESVLLSQLADKTHTSKVERQLILGK